MMGYAQMSRKARSRLTASLSRNATNRSLPDAPPPGGLVVLRRRQVMARTGLAQSSIYELVAADEFPRPVRLSRRRVGWIQSEVEDWIRQRIAARRELEQPEPSEPRQRVRSRSEVEI